jgi:hypothetical protein
MFMWQALQSPTERHTHSPQVLESRSPRVKADCQKPRFPGSPAFPACNQKGEPLCVFPCEHSLPRELKGYVDQTLLAVATHTA